MMATDGYRFFAEELGAFHWDNPAARDAPVAAPLREGGEDADAGDPRRAGLPRARRRRRCSTTTRCKAKGVPARLVWFPDENHWILKPQNSRLWYREFFAWVAHAHAAGAARAKRGARSRLGASATATCRRAVSRSSAPGTRCSASPSDTPRAVRRDRRRRSRRSRRRCRRACGRARRRPRSVRAARGAARRCRARPAQSATAQSSVSSSRLRRPTTRSSLLPAAAP